MPAVPPTIPVFGTPRATRRWARRQVVSCLRFLPTEQNDAPSNAAPIACVAVERYPEEWAPGAVRTLLDRYPLSAWAVACGVWASGGGRTGSPWPTALRCGDAEAVRRTLAALRGDEPIGPLGEERTPSSPPAGVGPATAFSPDAVYRTAAERTLSGADGPPWELWDLDAWDARREAALIRSRLRRPGRVRIGMTACPDSVHEPDAQARFGSADASLALRAHTVLSKWDPPEVVWAAVQSASLVASSADELSSD